MEPSYRNNRRIFINARFPHTNFHVLDLNRSLDFNEKALDLREVRRVTAPDGTFVIVFLGDGETDYPLELTWLRDREQPYDLGEGELHVAFRVADKRAAHALHREMGCICFENAEMNLYFIRDPDGYWLEILDQFLFQYTIPLPPYPFGIRERMGVILIGFHSFSFIVCVKNCSLLILGGRRYRPSPYRHSGSRVIVLIRLSQIMVAWNPIFLRIGSDSLLTAPNG